MQEHGVREKHTGVKGNKVMAAIRILTLMKASQNIVQKLQVFLNCMQVWYRSVNVVCLFLRDTLHMQSLLPARSVKKCSYLG